MIRVPQPPIDPLRRDPEHRVALPGLLLAIFGALLALFGLGRLTDFETVEGGLALEREVNMAFAHGGVRDASVQKPPVFSDGLAPPPMSDEAFYPEYTHPPSASRLRIDVTAKDPCPT